MTKLVTKFIGDNQVTYAKVQQETAATLLGNPTGVLANVQEITLGTNLSFTGSVLNAAGGSVQTPTQNQYYYVSGTTGGSDITGDGTYNKPFATVAHAMGLITTAGASNRFIIKIIGSKLQEPTNIILKPYVYIVGDHLDGTYIRINGGAGSVVPDASFVTGRAGIQNIYFGGGTSVNWDLFSIGPNIGTPSCVLVFDNVTVTGNFTYKGRTPGIDFFESYGGYYFGTCLLDACQNNCNGTTYQGATTLSSTNGLSNSFYQAAAFLGGLTISASATYTNAEQLAGCSINGGNLTITDAASYITLISDVASYPKHSSVSITGTPSISFLNDTYSLGYTPVTSANWSTVPTTAQQALDDLATSGIYKTQTANTLLAGPVSGGAALSTFRAMVQADISNNIVGNAQLAQMPTLTIKGNNTGGTANAADLTSTQVTAMLNTFVGDTGAGGTKGLVPAPAAGTSLQGDFLNASGNFSYVDQSKPDSPSFSLVKQASNPFALAKLNNCLTYVGVNGKSYGVTIGAVASTLAFYDITNQSSPTYLSSMATLQGAYNAVHALIGGVDYIIVASSGGFNLYIINASNPSLPTITTTFGLGAPTGSTYNVAYQNGYVYLACQNVGLKVVDIGGGLGGGTLLAPVVTYTQGAAKSFGVAVSGNVLYTTQYSTSPYATRLLNSWTLTGAGTAIVPSLTQSLTLPGLGETLAVSINSNTAFVSNTTGVQQIDIVDITTPTAMTNITSISMPGGYSIAAAMAAIPYGNYLFMPVGSHATFGGSILMYDITTRSSPILVSTVSTNVATSPFGGISILGQYIFAGDYGPAPGSLGNLDVFTLPLMAPVIGTGTASQLVIQNSLSVGGTAITSFVDPAGALSVSSVGLAAKVDTTTIEILTDQLHGLSTQLDNLTLNSTDITNQYKDLTYTIVGANSVSLTVIGGIPQQQGNDFTVGTNTGVSSVGRITFINGLATGGASALVSGDIISVEYSHF